MNEEEKKLAPNVIMPNKDIFIGAMLGFNVARKRLEENPQPLYNGKDATNEDIYLGSWLELTCSKCNRLYVFDNLNEIPNDNLHCQTEGCDNIIILYGIVDISLWRIGNITFEG